MDYALAIRRNRDQLKDIVLSLFALAGMRVGGRLALLPRSVAAMILMVLRPAEAAARRLIVIAAHGLAAHGLKALPPAVRADADMARLAVLSARPLDGNTDPKSCAFQLFDPLKRCDPDRVWGVDNPPFASGWALFAPLPAGAFDDGAPCNASGLGLRFNALVRALEDLPRQARRLKRLEARRDARLAAARPVRLSPMRPGLPPGWRQRRTHPVDACLRECHGLALDRLKGPDSG